MDLSFAAPPALKNNDFSKLDSYSCNKCSSTIKINSIDETEAKITFECLNQQENHRIQTLSINEYLKSMVNNIYISDKCSICQQTQNLSKNSLIFEYCTRCKQVICDKCKENHIKNNNNIEHSFIYNNEKYLKCLTHLQNNKYIVFCKECKMHLCRECLKSRKHLNHQKNALYELQLLEENKLNHSKIIDLLKEEMKKLNEEKNNKTKALKHKMNISKNKIKEEYENEINKNKQNLENKLNVKEERLEKELNDLKKKYLNEVQRMKNKFEEEKNEIICQYNKAEIDIKSLYDKKIYQVQQNINNDEDFLSLQKLEKTIKNRNDLIIINEILKNTQEKNENNYYFNENINNAIESFKNSRNEEIRKISNNNIQIQKKDLLAPEEDDIIIPQKDINNNINFYSFNSINNITNKLIKNYNNNNIHNNINTNNKNHNISNNLIYNRDNNLNDNIFLSKKIKNIDIEKEIEANNDYKMNKIDIYSNKSIQNYNSNENNEEINLHNSKREIGNKEINFNLYDIIDDSYCPILIDNSFAVFESIKKIAYLIYSTKNKYIISYNLTHREIESKIPSNHSEYISNFKYCFNTYISKELIMSISFKDTQLKIWRFEDWQCIVDIKNVYSSGYLYSACFLNRQNNYYFVTSNWIESKFADLIRVYDFNGNVVKYIKNSDYNSFSLKTLYIKGDTYILVCNEDNIKSFDYNKNDLYKVYKDKYFFCKLLSFQIYKYKQQFKILGSCHDNSIRVWDFSTGRMIEKIKYELFEFRGIMEYKENILIGIEDNLIKFFDLKNRRIIKTLNNHKDKICSITKKYLQSYGNCIFSQGFDDKIILWNIKK